MARIPDEEVDRLKREISLERLVEARGIALRKHGADRIGLCPFHNDRQPSLVISPGKNLWHCLGACQTGGSVIDWVVKAEGVSFRHAVELLRAEFLPLAAGSSPVVVKSTVPKLAAPVSPDMADRDLLMRVVEYYNATLKQSPEALSYLQQRGLAHPEIIDHFKLGFANRTLGLRLPAKNRKEGDELRTRLARLGVFREDTGHEHFNGSLVIPVFDEEGHVVELYGRKVTPNLRHGTPLHLYLPGPHKGIWNIEAVQSSKEIILCEALIDALTFWCNGYRNVTSSYGVGGFTDEHLAAFIKYGTERVLIAYDRDEAGDRAADALAARLIEAGISCYRVELPKGMDVNEYALKVQPPAKSLAVVIRSASWLGNGVPGSRIADEPDPEIHPPAAKEKPLRKPAVKPLGKPSSTPLGKPLPDRVEVSAEAADVAVPDPVTGYRQPPLPVHVPVAPSSPASPLPEPAPVIAAEVKEEEVLVRFGDRRYRVRGLKKNTSFDSLRVNVLISRDVPIDKFFVDTFDLYSSRQRNLFEKQAAADIGVTEEVIRKDLGQILRKLEQLQEENANKVAEPKEKPVQINEAQQGEAMQLLLDPNLMQRILTDFAACGVVGEETNKLVAYLAATSRKLEQPLAIIIQSSTAAGKSALMEAVLAFMPEEERVQYSAMTGQSLFYMSENNLKHKILAISEEEGAERASYALKLLQSEGQLTIASTGKDPHSGRLVTHEYKVEGPVMLILTTTAIDIDEELLNRCIVLTVDEDREQTRAIHRLQRQSQTLEGLLARRDREKTLQLHRNAQRLLRPILVANPHARELTFIDGSTRTRRDHMKYLTLIRSVALLHQHQREKKTVVHHGEMIEYIEVTKEDIELANRLAREVLGRSLDELPPQTRKLLLLVDQMVAGESQLQQIDRSDYRFSRKQIRAFARWGETQLRVHLDRLVELEYLLVHRGGRGQSFVYELLIEVAGEAKVSVLNDQTEAAAETTTPSSRGEESEFAVPSHPESGAKAGRLRPPRASGKVSTKAAFTASLPESAENAHLEGEKNPRRSRNPHPSGNGRDKA